MGWRERNSRRQEIPTGKAKLITSGALIGWRWGWRVMTPPCFIIIFPSPIYLPVTFEGGSYTFMCSILIKQSIILVITHTHFHSSWDCAPRVSSHSNWSDLRRVKAPQATVVLRFWTCVLRLRMHSRSTDLNLSTMYQLYKIELCCPVVSTFSHPGGAGFESRSGYQLSGRAMSRAVSRRLYATAAWFRS